MTSVPCVDSFTSSAALESDSMCSAPLSRVGSTLTIRKSAGNFELPMEVIMTSFLLPPMYSPMHTVFTGALLVADAEHMIY